MTDSDNSLRFKSSLYTEEAVNPAPSQNDLSHTHFSESPHSGNTETVAQNAYTHYCMEELAGFHLSRVMEEGYQDLKIDFARLNPAYKSPLYSNSSVHYSISNVLFLYQNYDELKGFLSFLSEQGYAREQLRLFLNLPTIAPDIRKSIRAKAPKKCSPKENKAYNQAKTALDSALATIADKIGVRALCEDIFADKIPVLNDITQKYPFESAKKEALYITDYLLKNNLPRTTLAVFKETVSQSGNVKSLLPLLEGPETQRFLQKAFRQHAKPQQRYPANDALVDFLESALPTNVFTQLIVGKETSYLWESDFAQSAKSADSKEAKPIVQQKLPFYTNSLVRE